MSYGSSQELPFEGKVEKISAYISDDIDNDTLSEMIPMLKKLGIRISYDILVLTKLGKLLLRINPLNSWIQRGHITEGTLFTIKRVTKVNRFKHCYLMLDQFDLLR